MLYIAYADGWQFDIMLPRWGELFVWRWNKLVDECDKGEKIGHNTQDNGGTEALTVSDKITVKLDACGLQCSGPIRRVFEEMEKLKAGQIPGVGASDPGFKNDIAAWCANRGSAVVSRVGTNGRIRQSQA